jgi:hypothetical protein
MPAFSYTISTGQNSTTPGNTVAANLNTLGGKPTSVQLSFTSSTANNDVTLQYTLDDLQRVASTSVLWGLHHRQHHDALALCFHHMVGQSVFRADTLPDCCGQDGVHSL